MQCVDAGEILRKQDALLASSCVSRSHCSCTMHAVPQVQVDSAYCSRIYIARAGVDCEAGTGESQVSFAQDVICGLEGNECMSESAHVQEGVMAWHSSRCCVVQGIRQVPQSRLCHSKKDGQSEHLDAPQLPALLQVLRNKKGVGQRAAAAGNSRYYVLQ